MRPGAGAGGVGDDPGPSWCDDEPEPRRCEVGDWSFEVRRDSLSDLRWKGAAVLRAVRFVVRDRDWRTATCASVSVDTTPGGVVLRGRHRSSRPGEVVDVDFTLTASGPRDGRLVVDLDATGSAAFLRNRSGLVVLHHTDDAGADLSVVHPDGARTRTRFPVRIAPHQPAVDIAELHWSRSGVDVSLAFTGDVFEMEDQRNWTDASFKTYSTPLDAPFPVRLPAGHRTGQRVEISAVAIPTADWAPTADAARAGVTAPRLRSTGAVVPWFQSGASTAAGRTPPGSTSTDVLVEPVLVDGNWRAALERAASDAAGGSLDVRFVTDVRGRLGEALDVLEGVTVHRLAAYDLRTHVTEPELWAELVEQVHTRPWLAHVQLAAGTRAHFTELNRSLDRLPGDAGSVTFSSTPQMHDTGRDQLVESLREQRRTVEQAVAETGRGVHVGPVTLRARFNAVATTPRRADTAEGVQDGYGAHLVAGVDDPRQGSEAFASWLVASAAQFSVVGVESITFAEVWGPRGLHRSDGSARPAAVAFAALRAATGAELLRVEGALPANVHVLAFRRGDDTTALVANVGDEEVDVAVDGLSSGVVAPRSFAVRRLGPVLRAL